MAAPVHGDFDCTADALAFAVLMGLEWFPAAGNGSSSRARSPVIGHLLGRPWDELIGRPSMTITCAAHARKDHFRAGLNVYWWRATRLRLPGGAGVANCAAAPGAKAAV
jgi:hypothetical protein